jgi:peroxiredoxin Q/BCP
VVLYFYPRADTPGCTTQACSLRDARPGLDAAGAVVLGISPDKPAAQSRFDAKYDLGFPLLSDPDHAVAEAYGAWGERSMYGKKYMGIVRSAFVIDEEGRIAETLYKVSPKDTVPKAMKALSG